MPEKICPKCNEKNAEEAVMCWSCYAILDGKKVVPFHLRENEIRFSLPRWWRENAIELLSALAVSCFISSGWWRGKNRFWALGTGLGFLAGALVLHKRAEALPISPEQEHPIRSITDTIMLYAVKDGASQIRLILHEEHFRVEYKIQKEWHHQMNIPEYVWKPLINELVTRAGSGNIEFKKEDESAQFQLYLLIEPPHQAITLTKVMA